MLILKKFACGCFGLGALTSLGMVLLQMPSMDSHSRAQTSSSIAGNALIQLASAEVDSIYREASDEIAPNLKSFAASSNAFVRSNATTARLQFEGMANSFPSVFAINDWLPRSAPDWTKSGVPGVIQAAGGKAITVSNKIPVVQSLKSSIGRMADMHPSLHFVGSGF
jgi:hypothetical protein